MKKKARKAEKKLARDVAAARSEAVRGIVAAYDGAARTHRTAGRQVGSTSANREIWRSATRLRDVMRDLRRNNAYAARAIAGITSNIVGVGIIPSVQGGGIRVTKAVQGLIADHLDTTAIDFDGRSTFYGLQALAVDAMVESGECFLVKYPALASRRLPLPFQVRLLEADFLDIRKNDFATTGARIVQGIEFDADGRRAAYWMFDEHPGEMLYMPNYASRRVPAENVIHLYRPDRPGQIRGIPWGSPVVMTLWDLADYEDAELMRQKIAACFAVFYTDGDAKVNLAQSLDATGRPLTTTAGTPVDMLEPGLIQRLPQGATVQAFSPPLTMGYPDYTKTGVRKIAVGFGATYEMVSGDLSDVNFSSGRLGWLEFQRNVVRWQWHLTIPHVCAGVGAWFRQAAALKLPFGNNDFRLGWTEPRREMIDPTKEVPAARDAIRSGLSSLPEEQRRLGYDPEKILAEQAQSNAEADKLGLSFDSDGRRPLVGPLPPSSGDNGDGSSKPAR